MLHKYTNALINACFYMENNNKKIIQFFKGFKRQKKGLQTDKNCSKIKSTPFDKGL